MEQRRLEWLCTLGRSALSELSQDAEGRTQEGTKYLHMTLKMWCLYGVRLMKFVFFTVHLKRALVNWITCENGHKLYVVNIVNTFKYAYLRLKCIKFCQLPGVKLKIFGDGGCRNHFRLHLVSGFTSSLELEDLKMEQRGKQFLSMYGSEDQYVVLAKLSLSRQRLSMEKVCIYCFLGKQKVFVVLCRSLKKHCFGDQVFQILQYHK